MKKNFLLMMFFIGGALLLSSCSNNTPGGPSPKLTPTPIVTPAVTPSVTVTPVPTTTFSYAVTISGNTGTGTITYLDNNGVWQNVSIPVGGISWVSPTFSVITGSGKQDGITVTAGGTPVEDAYIYESGSTPLHAHACCGMNINIPAAPL